MPIKSGGHERRTVATWTRKVRTKESKLLLVGAMILVLSKCARRIPPLEEEGSSCVPITTVLLSDPETHMIVHRYVIH